MIDGDQLPTEHARVVRELQAPAYPPTSASG
jgi:hypothetical protein